MVKDLIGNILSIGDKILARSHRFDRRFDDSRDVDLLGLETELAADDTRHVEEILDELRHRNRIAFDRRIALFGGDARRGSRR